MAKAHKVAGDLYGRRRKPRRTKRKFGRGRIGRDGGGGDVGVRAAKRIGQAKRAGERARQCRTGSKAREEGGKKVWGRAYEASAERAAPKGSSEASIGRKSKRAERVRRSRAYPGRVWTADQKRKGNVRARHADRRRRTEMHSNAAKSRRAQSRRKARMTAVARGHPSRKWPR
jgi:hypothetical protein